MATVRMSDSEVAGDFPAVLERVLRGFEVIVEKDDQAVAVIRPAQPAGRPISEAIGSAKRSGSTVTLDGGFAKDVEEGIRSRKRPWNPPPWD